MSLWKHTISLYISCTLVTQAALYKNNFFTKLRIDQRCVSPFPATDGAPDHSPASPGPWGLLRTLWRHSSWCTWQLLSSQRRSPHWGKKDKHHEVVPASSFIHIANKWINHRGTRKNDNQVGAGTSMMLVEKRGSLLWLRRAWHRLSLYHCLHAQGRQMSFLFFLKWFIYFHFYVFDPCCMSVWVCWILWNWS